MQRSSAFASMFLVGFSTAQLSARERTTAELRTGEGTVCTALTVGKQWTIPIYDESRVFPRSLRQTGFSLGEAHFELRQSSRLVLGVYAPATLMPERATSRLYSPDVYAVLQQGGKPVLERARVDEWNVARVLSSYNEHATGGSFVLENGKPLQYRGRSFMPSGPKWLLDGSFQSTILSADQAYLALMTWDGIDYPGDILTPHHIDGHYFIDIFRVSTARKAALIQGTFHDIGPGEFLGESSWTEGPRFVLPLSSDMRRLVLCEVR